jgi:hypothetical protein
MAAATIRIVALIPGNTQIPMMLTCVIVTAIHVLQHTQRRGRAVLLGLADDGQPAIEEAHSSCDIDVCSVQETPRGLLQLMLGLIEGGDAFQSRIT